MAKLPLRVLGIALLTITICVPGCQALFQATKLPDAIEMIDQIQD